MIGATTWSITFLFDLDPLEPDRVEVLVDRALDADVRA